MGPKMKDWVGTLKIRSGGETLLVASKPFKALSSRSAKVKLSRWLKEVGKSPFFMSAKESRWTGPHDHVDPQYRYWAKEYHTELTYWHQNKPFNQIELRLFYKRERPHGSEAQE